MPQKSKGNGAAKGAKAAISKKSAQPAKVAKPTQLEKAPKAAKPVKVKATDKATDRVVQVKEKEIAKAKTALKSTAETSAASPVAEATKPARSRKISVSVSANEASSALAQKWATLFKKSEQIESKPYSMKAAFEEKTAIVHKVLGWGYILANRNDRLEVLFKDGIKYLISNYKP